MEVIYVASNNIDNTVDSILDTAEVAFRMVQDAVNYARAHELKVFKVRIDEVE